MKTIIKNKNLLLLYLQANLLLSDLAEAERMQQRINEYPSFDEKNNKKRVIDDAAGRC